MTEPTSRTRLGLAPVSLRSWYLCVGLIAALTAAGLASVRAAITERVVSNPLSGLAIDGVDPVAYFSDGRMVYGRAEYEYRYAGVTWRFVNQGNQAAFSANPDVYMPRYGGYDPVAIGRDLALPGNPMFWTVVGQRIYLFYDERARARFIANPQEAIDLAEQKWPAVAEGLMP
jgi:YHS domain-containing protein